MRYWGSAALSNLSSADADCKEAVLEAGGVGAVSQVMEVRLRVLSTIDMGTHHVETAQDCPPEEAGVLKLAANVLSNLASFGEVRMKDA